VTEGFILKYGFFKVKKKPKFWNFNEAMLGLWELGSGVSSIS
jgi:hypothetical protein